MGGRVLVMGAGAGASNNLLASLRSSVTPLTVVGCHDDPFILKKSVADRNYLLDTPLRVENLLDIVDAEEIDLVIPTGDRHVQLLSDHRDAFGARVYLPAKSAIDLCQDKCALATVLAHHGVPVPASFAITSLDSVPEVVAKLAWAPRLWCRMRSGSRSAGATPVANADHAQSWLRLWEDLQGVPPEAFMIAEYLPGRDFLCQSLWRDGRLVLIKTFERLSYFGGENSPSGVSSLSALAKTVVDDRIVEICIAAVQAIDPRASGAFSTDLKENARGIPCITEVNAGRFFIGMTAFDHVGKQNMSACFVRLGLGEDVRIDEPYDCPPDYYVARDLDTPPGVYHADDILDGLSRIARATRTRP